MANIWLLPKKEISGPILTIVIGKKLAGNFPANMITTNKIYKAFGES